MNCHYFASWNYFGCHQFKFTVMNKFPVMNQGTMAWNQIFPVINLNYPRHAIFPVMNVIYPRHEFSFSLSSNFSRHECDLSASWICCFPVMNLNTLVMNLAFHVMNMCMYLLSHKIHWKIAANDTHTSIQRWTQCNTSNIKISRHSRLCRLVAPGH